MFCKFSLLEHLWLFCVLSIVLCGNFQSFSLRHVQSTVFLMMYAFRVTFIFFKLAIALQLCNFVVLLPHFPREFQSHNFCFSQGMATYLCTCNQVLYSVCQHLYKEKEPATVVSVLKERCSLLWVCMKEAFIEIAECTLLTSITMEGLNIWPSFPLFTIIQIQLVSLYHLWFENFIQSCASAGLRDAST